ncbi:unnamed protein product [Adineta steineri]|uniref:Uncharacterized protein n=1 Tax=Adineta steineri TaxID=433720 RepID=A0A814DFM8_9BILA|nr:unnamed protein product [Adineta steineri]CAF0956438.1 unnamed protein product [Adineta steineri]CAF0961462.1 unnamed protein product [Adineta steineri]
MANNLTFENHPLDNSSLWTVPEYPVLTSDRTMLPTNNDQNLPTYDACANPSASNINDLPPNYFDISIVPNGAVLYNIDVTPYTEASTVEIERDEKRVLSFNSLIDKNPDQLWLYFMTYLNEKPQVKIIIRGYQRKLIKEGEFYYDSNGNLRNGINEAVEVTDFKCSIDLSSYTSERWWRVAVMPSVETIEADEIVTLRDAIEQYTLSNKKVKEILMKKQIYGWNLIELRSQLIRLVLSTGYPNRVSVTYEKFNYKIAARSSSQLSRFANSHTVQCFCCLSCLCIICWPIYGCLRRIGSTRDTIVADYIMTKPVNTFLQLNSATILDTVINLSIKSYIAH